MKNKLIICLLISFLFVSGCTKISDSSYEDILNTISIKNNKQNTYNSAFKFYLPNELSVLSYDEYNEVLVSENYKYYLYVDIISYYEKVKQEYEICDACFYSKKIANDEKYGYLEINLQENNQYLIEIMYNYAKIEVMVDYDDINLALYNCVTILKDLEYNDMIIEPLVNNKSQNFKEETYDIFNPKSKDSSYLNIIDDGTEDSIIIDDSIDSDLIN
ncbi:MAG: hypothetical protein ACI4XR_04650 [Bacilli bacterium]